MSIKLDARLERAKNNPAIFEAHKQYLEFKPLEADLLREAEVATNDARLAAQIKPHTFALHRLPVATAKPSP
jgi:hypothetical protein